MNSLIRRLLSLLLLFLWSFGSGETRDTATADPVQYVEVTLEAGIRFTYVNGASGRKYMPEPMGSGAALFDYDGDEYLDLYNSVEP